jgi:hypothetical protein
MRKLFSLFLVALFLCWSLAYADLTPSHSTVDVFDAPEYNTSNIISITKEMQSAPSQFSSDASNVHKRKIGQIDVSLQPVERPVILTNYLFDDFEDGDYTSSPTWTMTSNGNGTGVEDWTVYTDPWVPTYDSVAHNGTGYLVGSDSDGGGALADEKLEISFNTPGGGGQLTLYYWSYFRAFNPGTEYLEILVDNTQVDLVTAPDDIPIVGDRTVILDSYNDGASHTLTIHYYADYGYVTAFDDVVITDDPRPVGSCCNDATGACVDGVEQAQCPAPARWTEATLCADLQPPCGTILGACCDDQGNCTQTTELDCVGSWYYDTSCDPNPCPPAAPPCTLVCPPNGIPEGESSCHYNWDDTTNGGCNSDIPVFSTINAGDTVCGTAGTYSFEVSPDSTEIRRDTDWYEIEITSDALLTWSGYAEYDFQLIVIDAGSRDCQDYEILQGTIAPPCSTAIISMPVTPGYYWLWAGSASGTNVHCGSPYIATVQLGAAPTGACCVQIDCVSTTTQSECDALQGDWYWQEQCPGFQCPIDYCGLGVYTNGPPDGNWLLASQCAPDYPFWAGTADDFVLPGTDSINITNVVSWHLPWTGQTNSPNDWDGFNVTIYENNTGTTPNSPGGQSSNNDSLCQHVDIIPGGVVYSVTLLPGQFTAILDDVDFWRIISPIDITLDGGVTYWLEAQPIMDYTPYDQVAWYATANIVGINAHLIFPVAGLTEWTPLVDIGASVDMAFCLYSPDWSPIGRCWAPGMTRSTV